MRLGFRLVAWAYVGNPVRSVCRRSISIVAESRTGCRSFSCRHVLDLRAVTCGQRKGSHFVRRVSVVILCKTSSSCHLYPFRFILGGLFFCVDFARDHQKRIGTSNHWAAFICPIHCLLARERVKAPPMLLSVGPRGVAFVLRLSRLHLSADISKIVRLFISCSLFCWLALHMGAFRGAQHAGP